MLKILERYSNPDDACYQLAQELSSELVSTFSYILDPKQPDFCPEYMVATYLTPEFKFLIKSDQMTVIRKFLQGNKVIVCKLLMLMIHLGTVVSGKASAKAKSAGPTVFVLSGYEEFQEEFTSSFANSSGRGKFIVRK